jgi:hypothetical protein
MRQLAKVLAALLLCLALGACGGDDGDDEPSSASGGQTAAAESGGTEAADGAACLDSWNADAEDGLKQLMALSNSPDADVLTGTWAGEEFSAEIFDTTTQGTGEDVTVASGDCVVKQVSDGLVLYVFVRGEDGAWHRLLESGDHPLAAPDEKRLDGVARATLEGDGAQSALTPTG